MDEYGTINILFSGMYEDLREWLIFCASEVQKDKQSERKSLNEQTN